MAYNENPYGQQEQQYQPSDLFPSLWNDQEDAQRATTSCLARVFLKMFFALLVTAVVSYGVYYIPAIQTQILGSLPILIGLLIAQVVLVIIISARVMKMSSAISNILFFLYAFMMGLTLSVVFLTYTEGVIVQAFAVSALMFGAMAIYGTITKRDLTRIGSLCFMALIGIILASIVNLIFFRSDMISIIISYIGVLVFVGLTAYDTQKIKNMLHEVNSGSEDCVMVADRDEAIKRISVIGALRLYLDFINLFLKILAIMGRRR